MQVYIQGAGSSHVADTWICFMGQCNHPYHSNAEDTRIKNGRLMAAVTGMTLYHDPRFISYTIYIINFNNTKMEKASAKAHLDYIISTPFLLHRLLSFKIDFCVNSLHIDNGSQFFVV